MRKYLLSTLALAMSLTFTGLARADMNVAVVGPLSGGYASFGEQMKAGAELAETPIQETFTFEMGVAWNRHHKFGADGKRLYTTVTLLLYEGGKVVGYADLKQLTIGFQLGGQAYSELIFFKTPKAVERFKRERLEFDAQVSAVAATKGAAANVDYSHSVAVFTLVQGGLMYEASVGGQSFGFTSK